MYNQNLIALWNQQTETFPNFSEFIDAQAWYNVSTNNTECISIHTLDDRSIIVHEDEQDPKLYNSLNNYLKDILNTVYNNLNEVAQPSDLERIDYVMECLHE